MLRPPRRTRTDTRVPYTTLFRARAADPASKQVAPGRNMRADMMDAARKCDPGQLFCSARCVLTALGRQRPALRQGIDRILPDEALAAPRLDRAAKRDGLDPLVEDADGQTGEGDRKSVG